MLSGEIPPNQTIYIKNLNEKIKKEELKRPLYCLFSQYGRILDVVALKTPRLRGQAWVAFLEVASAKLKRSLYCLFSQCGRILDVVALKTPRLRGQAWDAFLEVASASNAVRQMQNFPFYDKPMRIPYAKTKSDCIAEAEGTLAPKEKKRKQEDKAERKRRGDEGQQPATENGAAAENGGRTAPSRHGNSNAQKAAAPNNILFIENLPHETTSDMLELLFKLFAGFREVRMIDAKPGIAFVEYEDDIQSSIAMQALQGFKVTPQNAVAITFAKK